MADTVSIPGVSSTVNVDRYLFLLPRQLAALPVKSIFQRGADTTPAGRERERGGRETDREGAKRASETGAEQWASSKNSKLMRLFFFQLVVRFAPPTGRESHFPERKTTLRVTITRPRSNFLHSSALFNGGPRRRPPFFFHPVSRVRDEAIFRSWMERDSCSHCPSKKKIYLRVWNGLDNGGKRWSSTFSFFLNFRSKDELSFDVEIYLSIESFESWKLLPKFYYFWKIRPSNL